MAYRFFYYYLLTSFLIFVIYLFRDTEKMSPLERKLPGLLACGLYSTIILFFARFAFIMFRDIHPVVAYALFAGGLGYVFHGFYRVIITSKPDARQANVDNWKLGLIAAAIIILFFCLSLLARRMIKQRTGKPPSVVTSNDYRQVIDA